MDKIYFAKLNENAKIPTKRDEDRGMDIYGCIKDDVRIDINEIKMVPTGLISAFDKKYAIKLRERGSTGTKGMSLKCGVIDSGYRGEWFIPINNTSRKAILITNHPEERAKQYKDYIEEDMLFIYPASKAICQACLEEVPVVDVVELKPEEVQAMTSERADGALGSSGK